MKLPSTQTIMTALFQVAIIAGGITAGNWLTKKVVK